MAIEVRRHPETGALTVAAQPERPRLPWTRHVSARDRMFFTERLALMLEAGIPLHASLESLERMAGAAPLGRVVGELHRDVSQGYSFSRSLERQGSTFDATYVNLVAAAEGGGFVYQVLERLREMDEKRQELRAALMGAFSYPAFLLLFSCAVVIFVLVFVFPKFAELFGAIRDQLPLTTRLLMALSDFMVARWTWLAGGLGAAALAAWSWLRRPGELERLEHLALELPFVREVLVELSLVRFMYVLSLSLANAVPLTDALRACRSVSRSARFRAFVDSLEECVSTGGMLATGFRASPLVPTLVQEMVETGEQTGNLALVTRRVAEFYERQWRRRLEVFAKIAEPALLLVMGVLVGVLVASLILPIFKLSRAVG